MSKKDMRESPRGRSQLSLYTACNRKWAFKYLRGWRVPEELYSPLHFGSVVHECQGAFYSAKTNHLRAARKRLDELCPPTGGTENMEIFRDKVDKTLGKWYTQIGEQDLQDFNILMVEEELPLTLPNGYQMTVRVDRVMENREDGEIFVDDTKTTGSSLDKAIGQYMMHDQPRLYILAIRENKPEWTEHFTGWRTTGIFCRKAPRSPGGYNIQMRRSPPVSFTEDQLNDTLLSYAGIVDDIEGKLQYVGTEPLASLFPANYSNCNSYGRICEYFDMCPLVDRQDEPPANLEVDPWLAEGTVLKSFKKEA